MKRPWLLRMAPPALRTALYYRLYLRQRDRFTPLYSNSALHFAPRVRMNLLPTDEGHSNIAFTGFYELDLSQRLTEHARRPGGLMIDVGANYGYFSLLWAATSPRNLVMAFEASPNNQLALVENIILNELDAQIEIPKVGLGKGTAMLPFSLGMRGQTGWGSLSGVATDTTVDVPVLALDGCVSEDEQVEVLKIDVEGADTWVLLGAKNLLESKRIKHVYFEHNKECMRRLGIRENEALDFLRTVDYAVQPLNDPAAEIVEYYARPEP